MNISDKDRRQFAYDIGQACGWEMKITNQQTCRVEKCSDGISRWYSFDPLNNWNDLMVAVEAMGVYSMAINQLVEDRWGVEIAADEEDEDMAADVDLRTAIFIALHKCAKRQLEKTYGN